MGAVDGYGYGYGYGFSWIELGDRMRRDEGRVGRAVGRVVAVRRIEEEEERKEMERR